MDALKDLWASLVAGLRDRTTNPLTITFIISWCLWNYKFFVVLMGDGSTAERLKAIGEMYPHSLQTYLGAAMLYPTISALLYVFIYPVVGMGAIWVYRKYQVKTANLVKNVEKARTITTQERDQLVRTHEKERKKLIDDVESLSTQLTATRAALAAAEEQLEKSSLASEASVPSQEGTMPIAVGSTPPKSREGVGGAGPMSLGEVKTAILLNLSSYTMPVSLDVVSGNLKMNPTIAVSELRELKKDGLVSQDKSGFWGLTDQGAKLAVRLLTESE